MFALLFSSLSIWLACGNAICVVDEEDEEEEFGGGSVRQTDHEPNAATTADS